MRKIILLAVAIIMLGGCSYVGQTVDMSNRGICKKGLDGCVAYDQGQIIRWRITKDGRVSGDLSSPNLGGSNYVDASFTLFLIKNSVVVDEIGMVSGGGDLAKGIKFSCNLAGKDFDATTIGYHFRYK